MKGTLAQHSFAVADGEKTAQTFGNVFGVAVPKSHVFRDMHSGGLDGVQPSAAAGARSMLPDRSVEEWRSCTARAATRRGVSSSATIS